MKKVAAIILNYNSSDDCQKCLSYLRKQDYSNLSIIVVDNASPKKGEAQRLQIVCTEGEKLILNNKNKGFSSGNNVGLRIAVADGADWVLIINPDVELRDSHYISYVMEQLSKWPKAAVIGTDVRLPSGEKQNPMRELNIWEEIMWPLEMVKQKLGIWKGYKGKDETGYCERVHGSCFFISKKFLIVNDYLDENIFMYCEEPVLAKSVLRFGYRELYIKEVTANHEHYASCKIGSSGERMARFIDSRIYYIKNYSEYNKVEKFVAIESRKLQKKIWNRR